MTNNHLDQQYINELVSSFYALFDNRIGKLVRLDGLRDMMTDDVHIRKCVDGRVEVYDLEEFSAPRLELLNSGSLIDFHEYEAFSKTEILGNIAQRWSLYKKSWIENGQKQLGEGAKSLQFVRTDEQWRINSIVWDDLPIGSIDKLLAAN